MKRRNFLKVAGASPFALAAIGTASANGVDRDKYRPGGPKLGSPKSINLNALHTNEELTEALTKIENKSDRIELREIARSAGRDDPVWEVKVGDGNTKIHLITQIHGDEHVGTEVALKFIKSLAMSNSRQVDHILENLSFAIVPRVNPDGAMYEYDYDGDGDVEWIGRRQNTQAWNMGDSRYKPYYNYVFPPGTDPGYDMNRDFNVQPPDEFNPRTDDEESWWFAQRYMDMPYEGYTLFNSGLRLAPEIRGVTDSFNEFNPDYAITHHHKGGSIYPGTGNGKKPPKQTLMSVMAAYGLDYADRSPFYPPGYSPVEEVINPFLDYDTSTRSIKLNSLVIEALGERGNSIFDSITRYGYYPLWGSYLDGMCPNFANDNDGVAGMLYEVAYQTDHLGQKALGRQMELTKVGFLESFEALADDPTLGDYGIETYFDTPLFGASITPYR